MAVVVGGYELHDPLGEGGQAVVFLARKKGVLGFSPIVAVKRLRTSTETRDAVVRKYGHDGTLAWTFRSGDRIVSSALVDAKGAVLFGSQDDRVYCLEPDGHLRWSVEVGGDVDSSPTLAADGTIFVGSDDRKLYALRAPSAPPPTN